MALKGKSKWVSTSLTSTIEVLRKEVKLSNTCTAYLVHIPYTLSLISARNNRKKIGPIAFLFSQLHIHNVTSDALFHGGHLVMHSMRCAVQTQQNHLNIAWKIWLWCYCITAYQCCQLSWISWETPDFGPYLLASRLENEISWIFFEVCSLAVDSTFRQ